MKPTARKLNMREVAEAVRLGIPLDTITGEPCGNCAHKLSYHYRGLVQVPCRYRSKCNCNHLMLGGISIELPIGNAEKAS